MAERDPEIAAIEAVVGALEGLDADARGRVMAYVRQRLDLPDTQPPTPDGSQTQTRVDPIPDVQLGPRVTDIRSLREKKQPATANEMAAIVAYYLGELAPSGERKDDVTTADLEKYFKQAAHPLPTGIRFTLKNAAAAGYFDALGGGRYKLNPVGHNLVAHGLPAEKGRSLSPRRSATAKRSSTKPRGKAASDRKQAGRKARGSTRKK